MWVNISGPSTSLSYNAKGEGKEAFLAHQLSLQFCGWRDALYAGGIHLQESNLNLLLCLKSGRSISRHIHYYTIAM